MGIAVAYLYASATFGWRLLSFGVTSSACRLPGVSLSSEESLWSYSLLRAFNLSERILVGDVECLSNVYLLLVIPLTVLWSRKEECVPWLEPTDPGLWLTPVDDNLLVGGGGGGGGGSNGFGKYSFAVLWALGMLSKGETDLLLL